MYDIKDPAFSNYIDLGGHGVFEMVVLDGYAGTKKSKHGVRPSTMSIAFNKVEFRRRLASNTIFVDKKVPSITGTVQTVPRAEFAKRFAVLTLEVPHWQKKLFLCFLLVMYMIMYDCIFMSLMMALIERCPKAWHMLIERHSIYCIKWSGVKVSIK